MEDRTTITHPNHLNKPTQLTASRRLHAHLAQVNEVQAAITGMTDGTVDPDTVEIEGVETEAQKAKKEEERKKRQAEREVHTLAHH